MKCDIAELTVWNSLLSLGDQVKRLSFLGAGDGLAAKESASSALLSPFALKISQVDWLAFAISSTKWNSKALVISSEGDGQG